MPRAVVEFMGISIPPAAFIDAAQIMSTHKLKLLDFFLIYEKPQRNTISFM